MNAAWIRDTPRKRRNFHQSVQCGSQFECMVLETLAKFGERLDSLMPRVEGNDFSSLTPSEVSQTLETAEISVTGMSTNGLWTTQRY